MCGLIDVDLGTDDGPKWQERVIQVRVPKVLRQVVDEEVASFRALLLGRWWLWGLWLLDCCTKHTAVRVRSGAILLEGRIGL